MEKIKRFLIAMLSTYQYCLSPWLGARCRFFPSCSDYAKEAITIHGPLQGLYKSIKRLLKCHPLHQGGYDPVKKEGPYGF